MPNLYFEILKPQSQSAPGSGSGSGSSPDQLRPLVARAALLWFLFLMLAMVHYSYRKRATAAPLQLVAVI